MTMENAITISSALQQRSASFAAQEVLFNVAADGTLTHFREAFVTPVLSDAEVRGRCTFLFKKMVEGDLEKYLTMQTYVFWPNEATYYDTVTYEWKLKPGMGQ